MFRLSQSHAILFNCSIKVGHEAGLPFSQTKSFKNNFKQYIKAVAKIVTKTPMAKTGISLLLALLAISTTGKDL